MIDEHDAIEPPPVSDGLLRRAHWVGRTLMAAVVLALASAATAAMDPGEHWFGFARYPDARLLCNEQVIGESSDGPLEILWSSFAIAEPMDRVIAFYSEKTERPQRDRNSATFRRGNSALSIHPATATGIPSCTNTAAPGEHTIIVVSQLYRRGR